MEHALNENLFVDIRNIRSSLESEDISLDMGIARFQHQRQSPSHENLFSNKNGE